MGDVLDDIRSAAAMVAARARWVHVDDDRLGGYVGRYKVEPADLPDLPTPARLGDDEATVAFVLTANAVNFGSGWHPVLNKLPGASGAVTVARSLRSWVERTGPPTADKLTHLTPAAVAAVTGQEVDGPARELVLLWTESLRGLGHAVQSDHGGSFTALVAAAGGSAATLVDLLDGLPRWSDRWLYDGIDVPLYKRAQIVAHDLDLALGGRGPGSFADLDRLTLFADNLVPHVLRMDGLLVLDDDLAGRIDAGVLLEPGSPEEVELRAVAVHAVEQLVALVREAGGTQTAREIDERLWRRGQSRRYKAFPRPRCRTTAY